jgi:hypothetical protein
VVGTSPKTAANCTSCSAGYTLKADNSTCSSCTTAPLQCGGSCVDRPLICTQCSTGYTVTPDLMNCGINCYTCPATTPDSCGSGPLADNDTVTVCPIGLPGVGCWAYRQASGSTVQNSRSCMFGNANYTCSSTSKLETCTTLANGQSQCSKCCTNDRCNTFVLKGFNESHAASSATVSLLLLMFAVFTTGVIQLLLNA